MDAHIWAGDILISEQPHLTNPEAGRIHESKDGFMFQVGESSDKTTDFFLGRHIGKEGTKPAHRKLGRVPGLMKDVNGKEVLLGNGRINGADRKLLSEKNMIN